MRNMQKMKDSEIEWIGQIPEDWRTIKLKNIYSDSCAGEVIDKSYWNEGNEILYTCQKTPMLSSFNAFPIPKRTKKNDLLLTRNATPYIFIPKNNSIYSNVVQRITIPNNYDNRFVRYSLICGIDSLTVQGDTILSYNMQVWNNIIIPDIPLYFQQRIADFLDDKCGEIDRYIEKQQQIIKKLKAYKQSVITEAVTKGLDSNVPMKDSGIEWIGMIPEHWNTTKLRSHSTMLTPMRDRPKDLTGAIPWIRIEDYDGKYISSSKDGLGVSLETVKSMNLKVYPIGSILCTSSCDLGKCAIVAKELVSNQRFINIIPDSVTYSDYLYYLMLSNSKRLNHLSTGTIQANLSRVEFEHLMLQFPPFSEQMQISSYLDKKCGEIDVVINKKQSLIGKLNEYKKSLIYEAVTGKLEV